MEEMLGPNGIVKSTATKEEELYDVMLDKLYTYFVVEKNGAKVETVIQVLSILKPKEVEHSDPKVQKEATVL